MGDEITKAVVKDGDGAITSIYKDAASPALRSIGDALGMLAEAAIAEPLRRKAEQIRAKNIARTEEKLKKELPENITETKVSIAVPILERMRYIEEEELADAYAELLKNSCLRDRQSKVLPSYATLLSNLTSDEVRILNFVHKWQNYSNIQAGKLMQVGSESTKQEIMERGIQSHQIVKYSVWGIHALEISTKNEHEGFSTREKYFNDLEKKMTLERTENIEIYIENMKSLGIMESLMGAHGLGAAFVPKEIYDELEAEAKAKYGEGDNIDIQKRAIALTSLGLAFLDMCSPKKSG